MNVRFDTWDEDIMSLQAELPPQELGRGTFASVSVCRRDASSVEKTFKTCKNVTHKHARQYLEKEQNVLRMFLGHLFVVQLSDTIPSSPLSLCLIRCDMDAHVWFNREQDPRQRWVTAKTLRIHILRALHSLEEKRIIHLDIKPQNVLVIGTTNKNVRFQLADFGQAAALNSRGELVDRKTFKHGCLPCGTYPFQAKEVLRMALRYHSKAPLPSSVKQRLRITSNADLPGLAMTLYYAITLDGTFWDAPGVCATDTVAVINHHLHTHFPFVQKLTEHFGNFVDDTLLPFMEECLVPGKTPLDYKISWSSEGRALHDEEKKYAQ